MERVLVKKELNDLYEEILTDFCIGCHDEVKKYNITYCENEVDMITICALEYMEKFSSEKGNHKVHDIELKYIFKAMSDPRRRN